LAINWHAKSSGCCWHIEPIFAKSAMPPMLARVVNPPEEKPNIPMRPGSIAAWPSQVESMWSMTRLTCRGLSMMSTLRLWSA
jgi:hypothetical protein